jgi:hypothetical protein
MIRLLKKKLIVFLWLPKILPFLLIRQYFFYFLYSLSLYLKEKLVKKRSSTFERSREEGKF